MEMICLSQGQIGAYLQASSKEAFALRVLCLVQLGSGVTLGKELNGELYV